MKLIPILGEEIEINSKEKINKSLEVSENVHKSFFRSNKKPRPYLGEEFNPSFGDKFVKSLNVVTYSQKQPGCGDIIYKSECGERDSISRIKGLDRFIERFLKKEFESKEELDSGLVGVLEKEVARILKI